MTTRISQAGEQISRAVRVYQDRYLAGELVSALRAVRYDPATGRVVYARPPELHAMAPLGVSVTAATVGQYLTVRSRGELSDSSWTWTPGEWVLLGLEGALTQAPSNVVPWVVPIGIAISPVTLIVNIGQPITRAG